VKVAIAHPTYWPEVRRGAERLAHDTAVALAARGHRARIVTSRRGPPSLRVEDGVEVLRLARPPGRRLARRMFEPHVQLAPFTYAALRAGGHDFVVGLQAAEAAAASRLDAVSAFWHMGIPHRAWLVSRRLRLALVQQALRCDAVLALSAAARDGFRTWLGVEARVVHPPVDTRRFAPGGERSADPTIVCAADAGDPRKRVGMLVEAMPRVRRSHPRARLLLDARTASGFAGEGVEVVDMRDLPARYRSAWVSALPSWGEAFGLVLAEALACGTPVVGTRDGGIPEVLGDAEGVGALFDDDPVPALLDAIDLARDPAAAARCRAQAETFSAERCAERLEALYAELAA
jgi:glycosyltransferase involved in cell wall biosynthesis